jgi:hypothetical protein
MAMKIPDVGTKNLLNSLFRSPNSFGIKVRLFKATIVPAAGDTLATYTAIQADFGGYAAVNASAWQVSTGPDGTGHASTICVPDVVFTVGIIPTPTNNIFGYYVTDQAPTPTLLFWAEVFAAGPYSMALPGSTITVTPKFLLKSEF